MTSTAQPTLHDVTKRYDATAVLDAVSLSIAPGETVGVIGENGSGKSTLLRLLAGAEQPDNGSVIVAAPGGIGYLPQALDLPGTATVAVAIDHARVDIALAATLASAPELLLLDEPTNHLAPALVEELEQALDGYQGALVIVTDDRQLRRRFTGERMAVCRGAVVGAAA